MPCSRAKRWYASKRSWEMTSSGAAAPRLLAILHPKGYTPGGAWLPGGFDDSPELVAIGRVRLSLSSPRASIASRASSSFSGSAPISPSVRRPPESSSIRPEVPLGRCPARRPGRPSPAAPAAAAPRRTWAGSRRSSRRAGCAGPARGSGRSRGEARSGPSRSRSRQGAIRARGPCGSSSMPAAISRAPSSAAIRDTGWASGV